MRQDIAWCTRHRLSFGHETVDRYVLRALDFHAQTVHVNIGLHYYFKYCYNLKI